ncbi:MAG: hypothetical protein Q4G68_05875 [Planctomycetia bacterium]|nr:hypothetical protein [Planctomycetia bacterium]
MTKSQTLVEQIEQILSHPDTIKQQRDRVADMARRYARACQRVNEHLALCFTQISCGNNAEAVRISNDLSVMDEYNILYGSGFEPWREITIRESLEVPPVPAENMARNLAKAYESDVFTSDLQSQFRFQSLSKAPVRERLQTLYQLEQQEPQNLLWSEMIPAFEHARFDEMTADLRQHAQDPSSAQQLESMQRELDTTPWRTAVPESLAAPLQQIVADIARQTAITKLAALGEKVQNAWSEQDIEKTRGFLSVWNDQVARNGIRMREIAPGAMATVRQASAWLDQIARQEELEQRFEDQLAELHTLLKESDDVNELIASHSALSLAADSGNFIIPPSLEDSYRAKVRALDLQKSRRMRTIIAATLVIAGLVGAMAFLGIRQLAITASRRAEAELLCRYLDDFEGLGQTGARDDSALDKASKQLEALRENSPALYDSAPIREQLARFQILFEGEQQRQANIKSLYAKIEEKFAGNLSVDYEVGRLETLVRSEAERVDLTNVKKRQTEIARNIRRDRDSAYKMRLDAIIAAETALQNEKNISTQATLQTLRQIERDLTALDSMQQGVSATYLQMAAALKNKVDTRYDSLTREEILSRDFQSLTELVGNEAKWKTTLETIAASHANDAEGNDALRALDALPLCEMIHRWNTLITGWNESVDKWVNDAVVGRQVLAEAEELTEHRELIPQIPDFLEYVESISPFIQEGGRTTLLANLRTVLKKYSRSYWLIVRNEKYYYYLNRPVSNAEKVKCDYGDGETKDVYVTNSDLKIVVEAPHYLLVSATLNSLDPLINNISTDAWFNACCDLLRGLDPGRNDEQFDPVIKVILLGHVLDVLVSDPLFASEFQEWNDDLKNSEDFDPFVNFFQPNEESLKRQRQIALTLLQQISAGKSLDEKLARLQASLENRHFSFNVTWRWVGFINSEGGRFVCSPGLEKTPDGSLWTVQQGESQGLVEVGKCTEGVMECTAPFGDFVRGLPVFLKESH